MGFINIKMPSKRRNNGRGKKNKGHSDIVVCCSTRRSVPKDKAIKRFVMKAIVDASSKKDIQEASAYPKESFYIPKIYIKNYYSISAAIHSRIVRVRSQTRGDRDVRYTTKLRVKNDKHGKVLDFRTGGFAKPTPSLEKQLTARNKQGERAFN